MATAQEWMVYFYPYLFDGTDARYVAQAEIDMALLVAVDYRPACLAAERQNQAQAHLAAYVLEYRARMLALGITGGQAATEFVTGAIKRKTVGEVTVEYATSGGTTVSSASLKSALTGPGTPFAAWQFLWELCVPATVEGQLPVRRGAIITSYG